MKKPMKIAKVAPIKSGKPVPMGMPTLPPPMPSDPSSMGMQSMGDAPPMKRGGKVAAKKAKK